MHGLSEEPQHPVAQNRTEEQNKESKRGSTLTSEDNEVRMVLKLSKIQPSVKRRRSKNGEDKNKKNESARRNRSGTDGQSKLMEFTTVLGSHVLARYTTMIAFETHARAYFSAATMKFAVPTVTKILKLRHSAEAQKRKEPEPLSK